MSTDVETKKEETTVTDQASTQVKPQSFSGDRNSKEFRKNRRPSRRPQQQQVRSEFDQKMIDIRRVTRVAAGGRRFNFSVAIVIGNRKGSVGVGLGKAGDTALAIDKAVRDARKNLVVVPLTKSKSIAHEVSAKYCSSSVVMMPSAGKGLVAGGPVRDVLDFAGVTDINAKIMSGSKNRLNNARVAIKALKKLKSER